MSTEMSLLQKERSQGTFPVNEMTNLLDGSKSKTELRHKIENVIYNDPQMKSDDYSTMSWDEQLLHGLKRMSYFYTNLAKKMNWDFTSVRSPEMDCLPRIVGLSTSLVLHPSAFIPTVVSLGTKEQAEKWYPLSRNFNIIGCYAQTELGHGTNLQKLETTATYNREDETFVIHSPSLTSMKWWPGDLAKFANFALVMAQLVIKEKSYGMHAFLVQIRDLDTHKPLPGIMVGSIGPHMTINATDNGFLKISNVKIPRENMLAKYSEVLPDGTYIKKGNQKMMYASMVNLRVLMAKEEGLCQLQKACTIAARYSCVRRQGSLVPSDSEIQVMDYVTQQHKILPLIATSYVLHFALRKVISVYFQFLENLDRGIVKNLSELHIITVGIKAAVTELSAEGIEIVRRACGGHGFAHSSGLPFLLTRATASCTYEGENTVLYLQCARFLIKCAAKIFMGQTLSGSVQYLSEPVKPRCEVKLLEEFFDISLLLECFRHRTQSMLTSIATSMQRMVAGGMAEMQAWNVSSVFLVNLARAHMAHYFLSSFADFIEEATCSLSIKQVLRKVCALYGLHEMNKKAGDFLKDGFMTGEQSELAEKAEIEMLKMLRKDTVPLVDAFDFRDETLVSCLGAYDGNVYERLFEYVKNASFNQEQVQDRFYSYLKPHLHVGRDKLKKLSKL